MLCQRMLIGPWARTTLGAETLAAVARAAPRRNVRRVDARDAVFDAAVDADVLDMRNLLGPDDVDRHLGASKWGRLAAFSEPGRRVNFPEKSLLRSDFFTGSGRRIQAVN